MKNCCSLLRRQILEDVLGENVEEYEKFDKNTLSENKRQHRKRIPLWKFLLHLLRRDKKSRYITWNEDQPLEFRIKDTSSVAELWGSVKNKTDMTYEKLGRAMRYYYGKNIIEKVCGKRYSYRFILSRRTKKYISQFIHTSGMKVERINSSVDAESTHFSALTSEEEDDEIESSEQQKTMETTALTHTNHCSQQEGRFAKETEEIGEGNDAEKTGYKRENNIHNCAVKSTELLDLTNSLDQFITESKTEIQPMEGISSADVITPPNGNCSVETADLTCDNCFGEMECCDKKSISKINVTINPQNVSALLNPPTSSDHVRNCMECDDGEENSSVDWNCHCNNDNRERDPPKEFVIPDNWCETVKLSLSSDWELSSSSGSTSSEEFEHQANITCSFLENDLIEKSRTPMTANDDDCSCDEFVVRQQQLKLNRQIDPFMGYDYLRFADYDRYKTLDLSFHDLFEDYLV